jgi:CheY-like chemotaxis protein
MVEAAAPFVTLRSQCPRERQPQGSPWAALEDAGFEVIEAEHAEAALSVLQINAASIRVLFTDIQMPGTMDGLAVAHHHTAKNWPKIALLLTSARPRPHQQSLPEKCRFLAKPYGHDHVIRHIRELAAAA